MSKRLKKQSEAASAARANGAASAPSPIDLLIQEKKALAYDIVARMQALQKLLAQTHQEIAQMMGMAAPESPATAIPNQAGARTEPGSAQGG